MPTSEQRDRWEQARAEVRREMLNPTQKPNFRTELKQVRAMVIDFRKDDTSLEAMRLIIKVVGNIDALEKSLENLAYYVRHEDTRADDRDREDEIHRARYGF